MAGPTLYVLKHGRRSYYDSIFVDANPGLKSDAAKAILGLSRP